MAMLDPGPQGGSVCGVRSGCCSDVGCWFDDVLVAGGGGPFGVAVAGVFDHPPGVVFRVGMFGVGMFGVGLDPVSWTRGYAAFLKSAVWFEYCSSNWAGLIWPIEACRRRRLYRSSIHAPTSSLARFRVGQTRR